MGKIKRQRQYPKKQRKKQKKRNPFLTLLLWCILISLGAVGIHAGVRVCKKLFYPLAYEEYIVKYSNENDLDQFLVMAVIKTESNYIPDAHSGKASGLMQLTEDTAAWVAGQLDLNIEKLDLKDPKDNIRLGCYYLRHLIDVYDGNIDVALAAYNGGMGNVNKWLKDKRYSSDQETLDYIPFRETRDYVQRVNRQWEKYREMYGQSD